MLGMQIVMREHNKMQATQTVSETPDSPIGQAGLSVLRVCAIYTTFISRRDVLRDISFIHTPRRDVLREVPYYIIAGIFSHIHVRLGLGSEFQGGC